MTSFEFEWSKNTKPNAKVFVQKRMNNSKTDQSTTISDKVLTKKIINNGKKNITNDLSVQGSSVRKTKSSFKNIDKEGSIYIKRKQKKEKLANTLQKHKDITKSVKPQNVTPSLFSVKHKTIYVNSKPDDKSISETVFSNEKNFSDLGIHRHLISNLEKHSYTSLTLVQEKSIPLILSGKNLMIRSQTGSGKTLAYAVPILDILQKLNPRLQRTDGVQAIIIVPTRELALQVHDLFSKINTFQWIVVGHLCGGENRKTEKNRLRKGLHILIGTPGRLLDHILHTASFKINNVRCLVLDEADRLLDMGFKQDIIKIIEEIEKNKTFNSYNPIAMLKGITEENDDNTNLAPLANPKSKNHQTILLSATLNKNILELANLTMKDHIYVNTLDIDNQYKMIIPNTVKQEFIITYAKHKLFTLTAILLARSDKKILVFMATSQMVNFYFELFSKTLKKLPNHSAVNDDDTELTNNDASEKEPISHTNMFKLHGSMDQNERKKVFNSFRQVEKGTLFCTDVAARGIDIPEADYIIQYTGPQTNEDYLHRVGRTGRAGKKGTTILFLTHEEQEYVNHLQEQKVFIKSCSWSAYAKYLSNVIEEPDEHKAAIDVQHHFENCVLNDKKLHKLACFAYLSWSRFYNTYPEHMRRFFNFKTINLGHYVTSFALRETPSGVKKFIQNDLKKIVPQKLNSKLDSHRIGKRESNLNKEQTTSNDAVISEFSTGLEPRRKKKK